MTFLRIRALAGILISCLLGLAACNGAARIETESHSDPDSPLVVAAFYPLEFLAARVGGEHIRVTGLTPSGVEPHDLELTARQVTTLLEADLLVYVGGGFQPAVEDLLEEVEGDQLDVLKETELIEGEGHEEGEEGHAEEGEEGHAEEGEFDPHVWLDPARMVEITRSVEQSLAVMDSANAAAFKDNADQLVAELEELDAEFTAGLAECDRREIVTSHSAFGYLAARYNLAQHGISGLDPESEPSPQRLAEVAGLVREEGVTTIFFERLLPPDLAETIARETGSTTAVLDPLESAPEAGDYLSAMGANLEALRTSLDCR